MNPWFTLSATVDQTTGPGGGSEVEAWLAQILETMCAAKAWFRNGLTAEDLAHRSGLPLAQVFAACRLGFRNGYLQPIDRVPGRGTLYVLTPLGVAVACRGTGKGSGPEEGSDPEESGTGRLGR